jgi:hypothetical protein
MPGKAAVGFGGQRGAGGHPAGGATPAVQLILRDCGPDVGQLEHLVAPRLRVLALEGLPAPAAPRGPEGLGVVGGGSKGRCRRAWPRCPPGWRPEAGRGGWRLTVGGSEEGGWEEPVEFWFNRSSRPSIGRCCWRTLACSSATSARSARMRAPASGGRRSQSPAGGGVPALLQLAWPGSEGPATSARDRPPHDGHTTRPKSLRAENRGRVPGRGQPCRLHRRGVEDAPAAAGRRELAHHRPERHLGWRHGCAARSGGPAQGRRGDEPQFF